jgi:hypothetical protein
MVTVETYWARLVVVLCSGNIVTVKCRAVEGDDRVFDSDTVAFAEDRHWQWR